MIKILLPLFIALFFSACASLGEILASSAEVPTLERQMVRVGIGMSIVRQNDIMANHMPISADALWPTQITQGISRKQKKHLTKLVNLDPYYATIRFTDMIQRDRLGFDSSMKDKKDGAKFAALVLQQKISPLAYQAANKFDALYGSDPKNWPDMLDTGASLKNFLSFKSGKLKDIESVDGDVYYSVGEAIISLLPISLQKDLSVARAEMKESLEDVQDLEAQKSDLEAEKNTKNNQEIKVLKVQISEAKKLNSEKEKIYFTLLDSAALALQSDLNIDDESYVKLAYNIKMISSAIKVGSRQAYTSFSLALRKIQTNNMFSRFNQELESLAYAKLYVPAPLQKKYNKRVVRVTKGALYFIPNILMGTYYATKQIAIASKYESVSELIIEAYETKYK